MWIILSEVHYCTVGQVSHILQGKSMQPRLLGSKVTDIREEQKNSGKPSSEGLFICSKRAALFPACTCRFVLAFPLSPLQPPSSLFSSVGFSTPKPLDLSQDVPAPSFFSYSFDDIIVKKSVQLSLNGLLAASLYPGGDVFYAYVHPFDEKSQYLLTA